MTEKYYSQFEEDKILHNFFRNKKNGVCVEVGANDGVNDSNSYFFELRGWKCVLIEPNPALCQEIRRVRTAQLYECAVSSEIGCATLYIAEGAERSHGVSTISSDQQVHDKIKGYGFTRRPIQVKTRTLDDILLESQLTATIDFISIDVEGHELRVLEGFSIDKWQPRIIIIEDNENYKDNKVQTYLKKYSYKKFKRTGVNDWYASKSNKELVNTKNRTQLALQTYETDIKKNLKKIPILVSLVAFVKKKRV